VLALSGLIITHIFGWTRGVRSQETALSPRERAKTQIPPFSPGNGQKLAAFQRDLAYEPSYPWGRLFALLELLLTSTLIALFLLAVRRQFRR
jgi:hypothetical protein